MATDAQRRAELGKIHLAKKRLGLDEETYRAMLFTVARVHSARDLDEGGRRQVLEHLRARGFRGKAKGRSTPAESKAALLGKLRAQLTACGLSAEYLDGMARRMLKIDRYEWGTPAQLRKLVAALAYHQNRRAATP